MKAIYEDVSHDKNNTIKVYEYLKPSFETPLHFHPEFELVYIIKGRGIRYVGDNLSNFKEGDLVLLAPNISHCWMDAADYSGECHSIVMQWVPDVLHDLAEFSEFENLFEQARRGISYSGTFSDRVFPLLEGVLQSTGIGRLQKFIDLLSQLQAEKKYTLLKSGLLANKTNLKSLNRLNIVYEFVKRNYASKIYLQDVADAIHLSKEAFAVFFKRHTQKTFFVYLNEFRIARACSLLKDSDTSITQVCFNCGFESLPYFHRQFKRLKGRSPLQYKKQFQ